MKKSPPPHKDPPCPPEDLLDVSNPMQESTELAEEDLGYPLNMMSSLYYEFPDDEGDSFPLCTPIPPKSKK